MPGVEDDGGRTTPGGSHLASAATTQLSMKEPDFTFKTQPPLGKRNKAKDLSTPLSESIPEAQETPQAGAANPSDEKSSSSSGSSKSKEGKQQLESIAAVTKDGQSNNTGAGLARPQGKLSILVISGRNLASHSSGSSPYVVAVYDSNEFVGREPITETEAPVTSYVSHSGAQTPMGPAPGTSPRSGILSSGTAQQALQNSLEQHKKRQQRDSPKGLSPPSPSVKPSKITSSKAFDPLWKQEVVLYVPNNRSVMRQAHSTGLAAMLSTRTSTLFPCLSSTGHMMRRSSALSTSHRISRRASRPTTLG